MADQNAHGNGPSAPGGPPIPTAPPPPAAPVPEPEQPRQDSINPLWLKGWDSYSTWGWDSGTTSYYAQLYRNDADRDGAPTVWLDGTTVPVQRLQVLFMRIAMATREPVTAVYEALLHRTPDGVAAGYRHPVDPITPGGLPLAQVRYQLGEMSEGSNYEHGAVEALRWVLGQRAEAPASGAMVPTGERPSPLALAAESWAATAAVYMTRVKEYAAGAEAALMWATGKSTSAP